MTQTIRAVVAAVLCVGAMFAATTAPAMADTSNVFVRAAGYYFGGEDGNTHNFYVDPDIDAGMTEDQVEETDERVSQMDYWTFVAQVDEDAANMAADGGSYPAALNDELLDEDFDSSETYVVAVVTGDHIDARAYGDFSQKFKDKLAEKTRMVNNNTDNQANPLGLIQQWVDEVDGVMSGPDVLDIPEDSSDDGSSDEDSPEPQPTVTVTRTTTVTPSATAEPTTSAPVTVSPQASVLTAENVAVMLAILVALTGLGIAIYFALRRNKRGNRE